MKRMGIFLLFLSLFLKNALQAESALATIIHFPPEVSLDAPVSFTDQGLVQLDEKRIEELRQKYEKNFKTRGYFRYGSMLFYVVTGGIVLHQTGLLNSLLPKNFFATKNTPTELPSLGSSVAPTITELPQNFVQLREYIYKMRKEFDERLIAGTPKQSFGQWIWGGIKSFSQYMLLGALLAKMTQIKNYVDETPSFAWFFPRRGMIDRIDILKRSIKAITDFNIPADYSVAYHSRAIAPTMASLAKVLEEFIAFMNYYFDQIDKKIVEKHGMDTQARFLFNLSNDFFKKFNDALKDIYNNPKSPAVALIDDFRNDVNTVIRRCQFFEKELLNPE